MGFEVKFFKDKYDGKCWYLMFLFLIVWEVIDGCFEVFGRIFIIVESLFFVMVYFFFGEVDGEVFLILR